MFRPGTGDRRGGLWIRAKHTDRFGKPCGAPRSMKFQLRTIITNRGSGAGDGIRSLSENVFQPR